MHLALGDGEFTSFKVSGYAAYERQTRRRLEASLGEDPPPDPYPEPVEHCAICRWSERCATAGAVTTTCPWWPGCRRASGGS